MKYIRNPATFLNYVKNPITRPSLALGLGTDSFAGKSLHITITTMT